MKALAKERERRYASAIGLADDIERYMNHEPVWPARRRPPTACGSSCGGTGDRWRRRAGAAGLVARCGWHDLRAHRGPPTGAATAERPISEASGEAEKRLAQVDEDERHPGLDLQGPRPQERAEGRQAAVGGPGRAAGPGDGRNRRGGDRRPARRRPDADDLGHFAARSGLPADRAIGAFQQGPRHLRRRARPRPPRHAHEHEQPRHSYAAAGTERAGVEAERGDAGFA